VQKDPEACFLEDWMAASSGARQIRLLFANVLLGALLVAVTVTSLQLWLFMRLPSSSVKAVRLLDIKPGTDAITIGKLLQVHGVISDAHKFYVLCWLRKSSRKLQAGEYAFQLPSTPLQVLDQLIRGRVVEHRVTIPEGSTVRDVARILGDSGLVSEKSILGLVGDREFIKSLDMEVSSLEGYLFPDTYFFRKPQNAASILRVLVHQFWVHFSDEWVVRAKEAGLNVHKVVILASMVEKEAKVDWERPTIAAVFLNRLAQNMLLQCDPTVVYDLPNFTGPITPADLKRPSPYNTYMNKGLPAGPICNPGLKSLEAVLYPRKVSYLYFVSNNDGTHRFSETLAEHHQAVSRYYEKHKALSRETDRSKSADDFPASD
jgi:UPF0755 protein